MNAQRSFDCTNAQQQVSCRVRRPGGSVVSGSPQRIRDRTISIEIPTSAGSFALGADVDIDFVDSSENVVATVPARVAFRMNETPLSRVFGFIVLQPGLFENKVVPVIARFFNRRKSFRIDVEPGDDVHGAIVVDGRPVEVDVINLSASGICIDVPLEVEAKLSTTVRISMILALPVSAGDSRGREAPEQIEMAAQIVRRTLAGRIVRYGIHFDAEATNDFLQQQRPITEFIMAKQRALLQRSRNRASAA